MAEISKKPVSDFDAAVRLLSGGTNVAIYNDLGMPSIYVRRDKGLISDVIDGGAAETHYAFKVNGAEIPAFYVGKYIATVYKGRALSLPLQDPITNTVGAADRGEAIDGRVNFNNAQIWCKANGAGFHLTTLAEYAWISLRSLKNGTIPNGNNYFGEDKARPHEKGVAAYIANDGKIGRTLTGSGPAKWNDNWRPDGICDLNGNVHELQGGYRTVDSEIQIFADNDAAMQYEQSESSTLWRAILQDGTLVSPGTAGTLKWDLTEEPPEDTAYVPICLNIVRSYPQVSGNLNTSIAMRNLEAAPGILIPDRLKALALMPDGGGYSAYGDDDVYIQQHGECISTRGGAWSNGATAGVFYSSCTYPRTYSLTSIGFRPAFIPGI